ncbi:TRAP transporter large permease [Acuticoccus sp.]|uniref:TRAP transporter large permease n=1 Tax=Acuticoccus sp. TaxID=1904378 RepID=UPI003B52CAF3
MEALLIVLALGLLALGVPVGFALWITGLVAVLVFGMTSLTQVASSLYSALDSFVLLAIPFFVLAGNIMLRARMAHHLFAFSQRLVGRVAGGTALGATVASALFGAMTGSSVASAAALGRVVIPAMDELGYPKPFAAGLMAAGGTLGILIPPSVLLIIYAEMARQSVRSLFIAGVLPGIVTAAAIGVVGLIIARRRGYGLTAEPFSGRALLAATVRATPAILMPVIVLGGIYSGLFTPTEAAAVSVLYGLLVGLLVYRTLPPSALFAILVESARSTAAILFILSGALFIGMIANLAGLPAAVVDAVSGLGLGPVGFLLLVNVVLLALGCFLDGFTLLTILTPLLIPTVRELGIDPIHFAIVLTLNIEIAAVTPPVGLNLFVLSSVTDVPIGDIVRGVAPFVATLVAVLLLVTLVPGLSTVLV